MAISAQKQYLLPTGDSSMDEKEKPLIEVYLPKQRPGGPYELMPETGETTTETWSTQLIQWLKAKGFVSK